MADRVRFNLDRLAPFFRQLTRAELFNDVEVKSIVKKITDFEYTILRSTLEPVQYEEYIAYLLQLDSLRNLRFKRLKQSVDGALPRPQLDMCRHIRTALLQHTNYTFERGTRRFTQSLSLIESQMAFLKERGANALLDTVIGKTLALHPTESRFWIVAATHELETKQNVHAARVILQRGLRAAAHTPDLWHHYFRLELFSIIRTRERQKALGLDLDFESTPEAKKEAMTAEAPLFVVIRHACEALTGPAAGGIESGAWKTVLKMHSELIAYVQSEVLSRELFPMMEKELVNRFKNEKALWAHLATFRVQVATCVSGLADKNWYALPVETVGEVLVGAAEAVEKTSLEATSVSETMGVQTTLAGLEYVGKLSTHIAAAFAAAKAADEPTEEQLTGKKIREEPTTKTTLVKDSTADKSDDEEESDEESDDEIEPTDALVNIETIVLSAADDEDDEEDLDLEGAAEYFSSLVTTDNASSKKKNTKTSTTHPLVGVSPKISGLLSTTVSAVNNLPVESGLSLPQELDVELQLVKSVLAQAAAVLSLTDLLDQVGNTADLSAWFRKTGAVLATQQNRFTTGADLYPSLTQMRFPITATQLQERLERWSTVGMTVAQNDIDTAKEVVSTIAALLTRYNTGSSLLQGVFMQTQDLDYLHSIMSLILPDIRLVLPEARVEWSQFYLEHATDISNQPTSRDEFHKLVAAYQFILDKRKENPLLFSGSSASFLSSYKTVLLLVEQYAQEGLGVSPEKLGSNQPATDEVKEMTKLVKEILEAAVEEDARTNPSVRDGFFWDRMVNFYRNSGQHELASHVQFKKRRIE